MVADPHAAAPIAQAARKPVGIPYGQDRDALRTFGGVRAAVPYAVAGRHELDLGDRCSQCGRRAQYGRLTLVRTDAVQADAQSDHVEARFGPACGARAVGQVQQGAMVQHAEHRARHAREALDLRAREPVVRGFFAGGQVREEAAHREALCVPQPLQCVRQFRFSEPEPVHAGVQLQVHGWRIGMRACERQGGLQRCGMVHHGFQVEAAQQFQGHRLRVHDHDRRADAVLAQVDPFIGIGHAQVVHVRMREEPCQFQCATAVAEGFHHGHDAHAPAARSGGAQCLPVVVQIVPHRLQVDLQHGTVRLFLPVLHHSFQGEVARTFHQHHGIGEIVRVQRMHHRGGVGHVDRVRGEKSFAAGQLRPHGDQPVHARALQQGGHAPVQIGWLQPAPEDVAQDHHARAVLRERIEVVERDAQ